MPARKSIEGKRFGRWTVINDQAFRRMPSGQLQRMCHVICDCGVEDVVSYGSLISGDSTSCGCLHNEQLAERSTKHGHAKRGARTRTHACWHNMKSRCTNPNFDQWEDYGGRGIKTCCGWFNSYASFLADNGECPSGMEIDRWPNNDGHYSCGHCEECLKNEWPFNTRWATPKQQARHRRNNVILTVHGIKACLAEVCERFGVKYSTAYRQLKHGWSPESIFKRPA